MSQQGPPAHCFKAARVQIQDLKAAGLRPKPASALTHCVASAKPLYLPEIIFFSVKSGNTLYLTGEDELKIQENIQSSTDNLSAQGI